MAGMLWMWSLQVSCFQSISGQLTLNVLHTPHDYVYTGHCVCEWLCISNKPATSLSCVYRQTGQQLPTSHNTHFPWQTIWHIILCDNTSYSLLPLYCVDHVPLLLYRSTAFGLQAVLGRIGAITGNISFGKLFEAGSSPYLPILIVASVLIFAGVSTLFLPVPRGEKNGLHRLRTLLMICCRHCRIRKSRSINYNQ